MSIKLNTKAQEMIEEVLNGGNQEEMMSYHTHACMYRSNYSPSHSPLEFLDFFNYKYPNAKIDIKAQLEDGVREMLALDIIVPGEPAQRCIMHCEYDNYLICKVDMYFQR